MSDIDALTAAYLTAPIVGFPSGEDTFEMITALGITARLGLSSGELHTAAVQGAKVVITTARLADNAFEDYGDNPFGDAAVIIVGSRAHSVFHTAWKVGADHVITQDDPSDVQGFADKVRGLVEYYTG